MIDPIINLNRSQKNPTSYSRRSLLSSSYDSMQEEAFKTTLKALEQKVHSTISTEKELQNRRLKEAELEVKRKLEKQLKSKSNAQELESQITERKKRLLKEKEEFKIPGISINFHGYPNIPETPKQVKRQRELAVMKDVKKDLISQIENKQRSFIDKSSKEKELDLEYLRRAKDSLEVEKDLKRSKKQQDRELLTSFWTQELKAKELKINIERAARGQTLISSDIINERDEDETQEPEEKNQTVEVPIRSESPIRPKEEQASIDYDELAENYKSQYIKNLEDLLEKKKSKLGQSDTQSVISSYSKFDKRQRLLDKALQIKAKIDEQTQRSYQEKIKSMINEAKSNRKRMSNSVTPGYSPRLPRYSSMG